jgi:endonuclease G
VNKRLITILVVGTLLTCQAEVFRLQNKGYEIFWDKTKLHTLYTRHTLKKFTPIPFTRIPFYNDPRVEGELSPNSPLRLGCDRGHLVPLADLLYDKNVAKETFLMTNIVPQKAELNRGKWVELEEKLRRECKKGETYTIYTGPIYHTEKIPLAFFKIALNNQTKEAEAFVLPNQACPEPLSFYRATIQSIEKEIGHKIVKAPYQMKRIQKSHHWLVVVNLLLFGWLLYWKKK